MKTTFLLIFVLLSLWAGLAHAGTLDPIGTVGWYKANWFDRTTTLAACKGRFKPSAAWCANAALAQGGK